MSAPDSPSSGGVSLFVDVAGSRRQEAVDSMPACVLQMVAQQEVLTGGSGSLRFQVTDVTDGGGFASLLKGVLLVGSEAASPASAPRVAAAKIAVDLETDDAGRLTSDQARSYAASMRHEYSIYEGLLQAGGGSYGIPEVYFAGALKKAAVGTAGSGKMCYLSFMVMDLLGPSVGCLSLELQHYRHDVRLLVNHGCGMLKVLRCMHERGYVHCDVKPDNFCFPRGFNPHSPVPVDTVFVVDMGMARKFTDKRFDWGAADCLYEGTVDYSSVRALRGYHQTPKDDLESLAISLLEMHLGNVPFDLVQERAALTPERLQDIAARKEKGWQAILAQPSTPAFIKHWMRHLRSMPAKQHPTARDYQALQGILATALSPPPACGAAASTWSCQASVAQLPGMAATPATAVSSKRRPRELPAASAASNLFSTWSEADTAIESKRLRLQLQDEEEHEAEGVSMAGALLVASQAE